MPRAHCASPKRSQRIFSRGAAMCRETVIALAGRACELVAFARTLRGDTVKLGKTLNLLP
jgi:hypothetical protein